MYFIEKVLCSRAQAAGLHGALPLAFNTKPKALAEP